MSKEAGAEAPTTVQPQAQPQVKTPAQNKQLLETAEKHLADIITKKKLLDKQLSTLETNIYHQEQSFLEEATVGNIILGFDYQNAQTSNNFSRRKTISNNISDKHRLFSLSSVTFQRALELNKQKDDVIPNTDDEFYGGSASTKKKKSIKRSSNARDFNYDGKKK